MVDQNPDTTSGLRSRGKRRKETKVGDSESKVIVTVANEGPQNPIMVVMNIALGWLTPYEQLLVLRRKRDNKAWERFRDSLMRRWSNLNVINGLILAAVSTIEFSNAPLTTTSFTLGIISLLSSLIAIGFGVGLIYVLGDVKGSSLTIVDDRNPRLHLFAISIPEIWAFVSFGTFFADVGAIVWQTTDKGWIVKAGVLAAILALLLHLIAFGFLFREQDTTEYLIPDEDLFSTEETGQRDNGASRSIRNQDGEKPSRERTAA